MAVSLTKDGIQITQRNLRCPISNEKTGSEILILTQHWWTSPFLFNFMLGNFKTNKMIYVAIKAKKIT